MSGYAENLTDDERAELESLTEQVRAYKRLKFPLKLPQDLLDQIDELRGSKED